MSPNAEKAWTLLEKHGVDESVIEEICKIIDDLHIKAHADCPACIARHVEQIEEDF